MIKFAVMTPSLCQPGGAERVILIQARYGDPTRMQCTGIALSGYGGLDEALGRDLCRYTTIHGDMPRGRWQRPKAPMVQTTYKNLNEAVLYVCKEADVLLTWGGLSMSKFTAGLKLPVVCCSHTDREVDSNEISGITHLVSVSETGRRYFDMALKKAYGANVPPVAVIPNGIEVDRVMPRRGREWQRREWGVGPDDKVLLYLGRQAMSKNPWAAVEVLSKLPENYKLMMIGNQSFAPSVPMPRVVELVNKLGLQDRVKFSPPVAFVGDVLAGADCLLHLTLSEADSLAIKEAFMARLPVVCTPIGAIPELEKEFGQVTWNVALRPADGEVKELGPGTYGAVPADPLSLKIDPDEAVAQIGRALSDEAKPICDRIHMIAMERWTGTAMCDRWASYLEEVVASWK